MSKIIDPLKQPLDVKIRKAIVAIKEYNNFLVTSHHYQD